MDKKSTQQDKCLFYCVESLVIHGQECTGYDKMSGPKTYFLLCGNMIEETENYESACVF